MRRFLSLVNSLLEFADENAVSVPEYAPETVPGFPKINGILEIKDTREYVEMDDRWVPIPGTGIENRCDRCGAAHEVHVMVSLDGGGTAVVGLSCAKKSDMDPATRSKLTSLDNSVKKLAALESELEAARSYHREAQRLWDFWSREVPPSGSIDSEIPASGYGVKMVVRGSSGVEAFQIFHDTIPEYRREQALVGSDGSVYLPEWAEVVATNWRVKKWKEALPAEGNHYQLHAYPSGEVQYGYLAELLTRADKYREKIRRDTG